MPSLGTCVTKELKMLHFYDGRRVFSYRSPAVSSLLPNLLFPLQGALEMMVPTLLVISVSVNLVPNDETQD